MEFATRRSPSSSGRKLYISSASFTHVQVRPLRLRHGLISISLVGEALATNLGPSHMHFHNHGRRDATQAHERIKMICIQSVVHRNQRRAYQAPSGCDMRPGKLTSTMVACRDVNQPSILLLLRTILVILRRLYSNT